MQKCIILFLLACGALFGQTLQTLNFVSSATQYTCTALSTQPTVATITVTAASNASPVSFTAAAHGLGYVSGSSTLPVVSISGATLTWGPINGIWTVTPTATGSFTIAVDTTTFGALTGTLVVTTVAPLVSAAVWRVEKFIYDGSTAPLADANNLLFHGYGSAPAGAGGTVLIGPSLSYNQICANRASLSYQ